MYAARSSRTVGNCSRISSVTFSYLTSSTVWRVMRA